MSDGFETSGFRSPRLCPQCGLLVAADAAECQCGHVFPASGAPGTAAHRAGEAVDLFSGREALAIGVQALSELRGGLVPWLALIAFVQLLPTALAGPRPQTPRELAILVACGLLSSWVGYGLSRVALAAVRGQGVDMRRALLSPFVFLRILVTLLVMGVAVGFGLLFFIAPGVYLLLTWSQVGFLILDGRARHFDALRESEQLTRDRKMELLVALGTPILLQVPSFFLQAAATPGGSVISPGFLLFLVGLVWQALVATYGIWVGAVAYHMLTSHRPPR